MKIQSEELTGYNMDIDPIEENEENAGSSLDNGSADEDRETEAVNDLHEIQVDDDINEPDPEDTQLDPTILPDIEEQHE